MAETTASPGPSVFSRLRGKLLVGIALGAAVFLGFSIYTGYRDLLDALGLVKWHVVAVIFLLALGNYVLRFFKWDFYLRRLGIAPKRTESAIIFFSGLVMVITPGKMGEVLKSYLLKRTNGTPISRSVPVVVAERLTDFLALLILCTFGIGIYSFASERYVLIGSVLVIAAFIAAIAWRGLSMKMLSLLERLPVFRKMTGRLRIAYESMYELNKPLPLLWATLLSTAAWFCECLGLWFVVTLYMPDAGVITNTFIYAVSTLVGAISPGGLGPTEVGMAFLLQTILDLPKQHATAATFLIRIATLWFAVLIGAVVLGLFQKRFEGVTDMMDEGEE